MSDTGEANRARERSNGARPLEARDRNRRDPGAASVSRRWWEDVPRAASPSAPLFQEAAPAGEPDRPLGVSPPPPPPPPIWSAAAPPSPAAAEAIAADAARIQRLEQELAAARDEATALHEMLEDLPEIFEHKFRQRLHGVLEQQQLLLADNRLLREQLFALQPGDPERDRPRLLPPASGQVELPATEAAQPLRRVLHGMRRIGRRLRSGRLGEPSADDLSDRDDGQPRVA